MKRQKATWKLILDSLQENIPVMLLYVLESIQSSPGRQGFFMAVNAEEAMEGSIGGGIMEYKFVEMAKKKLREDEDELSVYKQVHDKLAAKDQSGMICSGEQTIFIYKVPGDNSSYINGILKCLEQNRNGTLTLSPAGIYFSQEIPDNDFELERRSDEDWFYTEKVGYKNHLYIVGGGHCSLALSKIMAPMDFRISVFDDRKGLHTIQHNSYAHTIIEGQDYTKLAELIPSGKNNYVVIMTFGYRTDDIVIRSLIGNSYKYIGVLGSKNKIEKMFDEYRKEGIPGDQLNIVHAPIGIQIKSQTPEEIAVSIAAEIIKIKNS